MSNNSEKHDYQEYPKTLPPDDYWGQVRRTVNGERVSEDQITMIVDAIKSGLEMTPDDVLLDLACGNGALTSRLFDCFASGLGVDSSEYLIEVASKNFKKNGFNYLVDSVEGFFGSTEENTNFTKVLCYGSFSFFDPSTCELFFNSLTHKFLNVDTIFIGNVPDRDRAKNFFKDKSHEELLDQFKSQIGIWRSREEWQKIAEIYGWALDIKNMPTSYFAAHYRFDVILKRAL